MSELGDEARGHGEPDPMLGGDLRQMPKEVTPRERVEAGFLRVGGTVGDYVTTGLGELPSGRVGDHVSVPGPSAACPPLAKC